MAVLAGTLSGLARLKSCTRLASISELANSGVGSSDLVSWTGRQHYWREARAIMHRITEENFNRVFTFQKGLMVRLCSLSRLLSL
jgi:hypothetical protein